MQDIIVEKPYRFVPPYRGERIPAIVQRMRVIDRYLKRTEGIHSYELRGMDYLRESLRQQAGIVLAPNHCRYADPLTLCWVLRPLGVLPYAMASWHLFQSRIQTLAIRLCGGFSVNREGVDRQALDMAIGAIVEGKRPLILFPEGTVFRSNDRLQPLLDGIAFIGRSASKRRLKQGKPPAVIHPVAIKYLFRGDVVRSISPIVEEYEKRFAWHLPIRRRRSMLDRVRHLSEAFLASKELEHLGGVGQGDTAIRRNDLIEKLLRRVELEWSTGDEPEEAIIPRIKSLRLKMVPELIDPATLLERKESIRNDLNRIYVAQQISSYPQGYLDAPVTNTRLLETVEQLDEDLRDHARIHRPLHAILEIGPPIEVADARPPKNSPDPLMADLDARLREMLEQLSQEADLVSSTS